MKLKLDENLPGAAKLVAISLGHDVDTVGDEGLNGAGDPIVFEAIKHDGRFLVTLDRGFGDIRAYPPGSHPGIAVLRLDSQDAQSASTAVRRLLEHPGLGDLAGCVVVVRDHLVRVRRP